MKIQFLIQQNSVILSKIYRHPFNRGLAKGNLPNFVFRSFLKQDELYLRDYARALSLVAQRLQKETHAQQFVLFAEDTVKMEREVHLNYLNKKLTNSFFSKKSEVLENTKVLSDYTKHLLDSAKEASIEEAVVSLVPCFWIYKELGEQMNLSILDPENPYRDWIASYSDEQFRASTRKMVEIADELIEDIVCLQQQEKVTLAFLKSAEFEYRFFDEIFCLQQEDQVSLCHNPR